MCSSEHSFLCTCRTIMSSSSSTAISFSSLRSTWNSVVTVAAATAGLLLVNGLAWVIFVRSQRARDSASCSCARCGPASENKAFLPIASSPPPVQVQGPLDPHHSLPSGEIFERQFTAFPACDPPIRRQVRRDIHCRDTFEWLGNVAVAPEVVASSSSSISAHISAGVTLTDWSGCSVISSVPDVSETGLTLEVWRPWFIAACTQIFKRLHKDNAALLYQTDVLVDGRWESKAALCMRAAEAVGLRLVWHKVVVLRSIRTVRGSTAGFTHLLCFSREHKQPVGIRTPDVLAARGPMLWQRAMGLRACEVAVDYIRQQIPSTHTIVDPFCGSGSVLAMANARGLHAVGVDHSRSRCAQAADLSIERVLGELLKDDEAYAAAVADLESGQMMDGKPTNETASVLTPFRTASEKKRREARAARKEARKALGISQKQQQQMEREARLKKQQQEQAASGVQ